MKTSYIIAIIMVAVLIGIIISMYGSSSEYATFTTAAQNPDKSYHIVGHLDRTKPQLYNELKDPNYFEFYLKDSLDNVSKVIYRSPRPQDFERSENVVVKGKMKGDAFEAKEILLKCPSKYNATEVQVTEYKAAE
ncbi:cytochrome c maturation protein CcmE [Oscillatoria amoena NRMC-F 0135]|nr:cytochrome c maturation protein CcmE [Oscillatoria amoena NRMC-F 0135]